MQSYQIFKSINTDMNKIFCMSLKDDIHWDEYCLLLSKRKKVNTEELVAMKPVEFPLEKQVDFYNKIKQYIPS